MDVLRPGPETQESDLFEVEATRGLLDTLLTQSRLYRKSSDYKALLDFVVRLRNFAPFNAMLLQMQKPGLRYAASASDWWKEFRRTPKEFARPLLILWPFGPVGLVYDVMDTEGDDLPEDVSAFPARGPITEKDMASFRERAFRNCIQCEDLDAGDGKAGSIKCIAHTATKSSPNLYQMMINKNHPPPVQFVTLAHELAHLFLGHLGPDKELRIPLRPRPDHRQSELEAESVAFIVCERSGVSAKSQTYLKSFVTEDTTTDTLDIYRIMSAAGQIENLLGLGRRTTFDQPRRQSNG